MSEESHEVDDVVMRWLGERNRVLLDEICGHLDIKGGLASIMSDSPDTP